MYNIYEVKWLNQEMLPDLRVRTSSEFQCNIKIFTFKRGIITHALQSAFSQFQERPKWMKLWLYAQKRKCCWKKHKLPAWPFRSKHNSDHTVTTAATYSVRELSQQVNRSLQIYIPVKVDQLWIILLYSHEYGVFVHGYFWQGYKF